MTRDTWHVTPDTWRDTWRMTYLGGGWTFSQNFSSLALTVCDLLYYEYLEEKDDSLNESVMRLFIEQPRHTGSINNLKQLTLYKPRTNLNVGENKMHPDQPRFARRGRMPNKRKKIPQNKTLPFLYIASSLSLNIGFNNIITVLVIYSGVSFNQLV